MARPEIEIPPAPVSPYPVKISKTKIIPGFGRGSSDLGFPTANIDIKESNGLNQLDTGVYFGFVKVYKSETPEVEDKTVDRVDGKSSVTLNYGRYLEPNDLEILPMVMSLGWNPYYGNKEKTCEIYIIHNFKKSFYGADLSAVVCGYLRPELDYEGIEALKKDIQLDVDIGLENLQKPGYLQCKSLLE